MAANGNQIMKKAGVMKIENVSGSSNGGENGVMAAASKKAYGVAAMAKWQ
jgi:hypothetical protein